RIPVAEAPLHVRLKGGQDGRPDPRGRHERPAEWMTTRVRDVIRMPWRHRGHEHIGELRRGPFGAPDAAADASPAPWLGHASRPALDSTELPRTLAARLTCTAPPSLVGVRPSPAFILPLHATLRHHWAVHR